MAASAALADVSIVVVTWHSAADVPALCASLAPALAAGAELVVVENGSGDAAPALVRAAVPGATVIVNDANRGFAAAANQGFRAGARPWVCFVNPDAEVGAEAIARVRAVVAADTRIAIAGCRTLNSDGSDQATVDRFHSVGGLVREALGTGRLLGGPPRGTVPAATGDVDWLYGSFLFCRRAALEPLGGFDEAYEMYGEDLDLCHRAHAAGWRVVWVADAVIVHHGNRSGARRYGPARDVAVLRGTLRFFRRRRGRGAERVFRAVAGTSFAVKALVHRLGALAGDPDGARRARAAAYARMAWLCAAGDRPVAGCSPGERLG